MVSPKLLTCNWNGRAACLECRLSRGTRRHLEKLQQNPVQLAEHQDSTLGEREGF